METLSEYFKAALYYIDGEPRLRAATAREIRNRIDALEAQNVGLKKEIRKMKKDCTCQFGP